MEGADLTRREPMIAVSVVVAAAACWIVAARQMSGMDMGPGGSLGSLTFFIGTWATMMAAMMLPSAVPALQRVAAGLRSAALWVVGYLGVWTLVGIPAFSPIGR